MTGLAVAGAREELPRRRRGPEGHGRSQIMPNGAYAPDQLSRGCRGLDRDKVSGSEVHPRWPFDGCADSRAPFCQAPRPGQRVVSIDGSPGSPRPVIPVSKTTDDLNAGDPGVVGAALFEAFYDPATPPRSKRWHARRLQGMPLRVVRESFGPLFLGPAPVGAGAASGPSVDACPCRSTTCAAFRNRLRAMGKWFSNP